jgi:hypothetical protein
MNDIFKYNIQIIFVRKKHIEAKRNTVLLFKFKFKICRNRIIDLKKK